MKMTMHIDEGVLAEVMELTGIPSKTEAVRVALEQMAKRCKFARVAREGLGLTPDELKGLLDPASAAMSLGEPVTKAPYGLKKRSRR
jgi:hypothetical protein